MNRTIIILSFIFLLSCTSKQEEAVRYLNSGLTKMTFSDNKGAINDLTKVIKLQPNNYEAYFNRGCCYFNLRDTQKAMIDFNKAIQLNPTYAEAFYNRALLKNSINDREGACIDWNEAVKLGKSNIKDSFKFCRQYGF